MSRSSRPAVRSALRGAAAITTGLAVAVVPVAVLANSAAATTTPVTTASTTPAATVGCKTGALPSEVQGRSAAFTKGLPAGVWVWHDRNGFHLRVTHDSKTKLTFGGTIVSSAKLTAQRIRAERYDVIWRNSQNNAIRFSLRNYGGVDGIDFKAGCAKKVTLTLRAAGAKLTTAQIFLGSDAVNPAANPFVIQRTVPVAPPVCASGVLPGNVEGRSAAFKAGLPAGAWVWHDARGFHLRVTHAAKTKLTFSGSIVSSKRISAQLIRAERNDVIWRSSAQNSIRFTLRNYGGVDGIDFKVGCAKNVTLTLKASGALLATTQIHLGAAEANPTLNPFVITRTVPGPTPMPVPIS